MFPHVYVQALRVQYHSGCLVLSTICCTVIGLRTLTPCCGIPLWHCEKSTCEGSLPRLAMLIVDQVPRRSDSVRGRSLQWVWQDNDYKLVRNTSSVLLVSVPLVFFDRSFFVLGRPFFVCNICILLAGVAPSLP